MSTAKAVSQCRPKHIKTSKGKVETLTNTTAAKVMHRPNDYETWNQWVTNAVAGMMFEGESFSLAKRDNRGNITSLHIMPAGTCSPYIAEDGSLFYSVGTNPMIAEEIDYLVPARDILHLRQYTPRHPLIGESAIKAASLSIGINVALNQNQAAFFSQMNRPSGVLTTDMQLTKDQLTQLRSAFDDQSKTWNQGGMPILSNGLKFQQLGVSSVDAQLIGSQRMSVEEIARVFGVPLPVIGDLSHATLSNVESLINMWLSISLGSTLENIERSLDRLFDLPANEAIDLDTAPLLRTDFMGKIDGLTKGIQGGLFTPNEGRAQMNLSDIPNGDQAFMQRQMTSLDLLKDLNQNEMKDEPQPPAPTPPPEEKMMDKEMMKYYIQKGINA